MSEPERRGGGGMGRRAGPRRRAGDTMSIHKHGSRPRRRLPAAVLALCAAAVLVAACSSGSGGQQGAAPVASLSGRTAGSTASGPPSSAQSDQDMISFTRCMRGHGVQMSDPVHRPGHSGLSIDMPAQDAANRSAYSACIHFIQPVIQAKQAGAAAQAAPQLPALTHYAQCMRSHDIEMPDPTPDGELNLGRVPGMNSDFGRYSPQFRSADAACRHLLPAGVRDNGTGP
jgi:hypothetical protein